jgi:tRNA(fMet)-specific endonuclease VapC
MYLLDTNHCSRIIFGDSAVIDRAAQVGENNLFTCTIVQGELFYMVEKSQRRSENLATLEGFLQDLSVYGVDEQTAQIYGQLKSDIFNYFAPTDVSKRRKASITSLGFGDNDLWIAAIALQHQLTLVSCDSDFQRMQQARSFPLESWMSKS